MDTKVDKVAKNYSQKLKDVVSECLDEIFVKEADKIAVEIRNIKIARLKLIISIPEMDHYLETIDSHILSLLENLFLHSVCEFDSKYLKDEYGYLMYYYGWYYGKNSASEAITWYAMSAGCNFPKAMNILAQYNKMGIHIEKNLQQAINLYDKSASLGNINAMIHMARYYLVGAEPWISKDETKAIQMYRRLVNENNNPYAMFHLAYCYENGIALDKDIDKAQELYQKSCELEPKLNPSKSAINNLLK